MLTNHKMKRILSKIPQQVQVDPLADLIEKKQSAQGEDYYCFRGGFCFSYIKKVTETGFGLSKFEWEGNEISISASNELNSRACTDIWRMPRGSNTKVSFGHLGI